MAAKDTKEIILELVEELMKLLGVEADIEVETGKDDEGETANIVINPDDEAGLLIGSHGTTLNAIQSFVSLSLKQKTGEWIRATVDVGDWRQKHNEQLEDLAENAASRAKDTGEAQHLYNLSPGQRRVVHMALSKQEGIETTSEGEGAGRFLVVKPSE